MQGKSSRNIMVKNSMGQITHFPMSNTNSKTHQRQFKLKKKKYQIMCGKSIFIATSY